MDIKIKKLSDTKDLKKWVGWLNNKVVTKYSEQRFTSHTLYTQKSI